MWMDVIAFGLAAIVALILLLAATNIIANTTWKQNPQCRFSESEQECRCVADCEEIGNEYFKQESGRGYDDCWCKEGNATVQIW